jgi:hypothetical protein
MGVGRAPPLAAAVPAGDGMTDSSDGSSMQTAKVWVALVLVGVGSIGLLSYMWAVFDPAFNTLGYELARTLMQVIGVTVIGGVITLATSTWQEGRRQAAQALEHDRQQFEIRAALLDR